MSLKFETHFDSKIDWFEDLDIFQKLGSDLEVYEKTKINQRSSSGLLIITFQLWSDSSASTRASTTTTSATSGQNFLGWIVSHVLWLSLIKLLGRGFLIDENLTLASLLLQLEVLFVGLL